MIRCPPRPTALLLTVAVVIGLTQAKETCTIAALIDRFASDAAIDYQNAECYGESSRTRGPSKAYAHRR